MTVAVLGTGQLGTALGLALARGGVAVAIGSRDPARAQAAAARIRSAFGGARTSASDHRAAVEGADVVVLAVDYRDALALLPRLADVLAGKIVVDPTTPWGEQVPATSASAELARLLPPRTPLVAAWKTTFAGELSAGSAREPGDVLVCGDDPTAKRTVAELVRATGSRPLDCGGLEHARTLEGITRMMGPILRGLGAPEGSVPALRLSVDVPRS